MSFNKKFFTTGGIVAASGVCKTDSHDIFPSGVALYNLDYDASDASGNYDGTPTDVTFGVGGQINYGARFDGSSSQISLPTSLVNSQNSFTVSLWAKTDTNTTYSYLFSFGQNVDTDGFGLARASSSAISGGLDGNGLAAKELYLNTGASFIGANFTIEDDTWYHFAVSYTGETVKIYVNGTLEETYTSTQNIPSLAIPSSGNSAYIGRYVGTAYNWKGDIDQFRVFHSVLTDDQVSTLYEEEACVYTATANTADFPSTATAVAHYPLDNSAEDNKGTNDGTETNIEYRFGRYGQAAVFNGSSSSILLTSTGNSITNYDQDFSISIWINIESLNSNRSFNILFTGGGTRNVQFLVDPSTGGYFQLYTTPTNKGIVETGQLSNNTWHHLVATRSKTNGMVMYLNGQQVDTDSYTDNAAGISNKDSIGSYWDGSRNNFDGKIDQVRIFSTELDSDEVLELYEDEKPETDTSNFKTVLYEGDGGSQYISNVGIDLETNGGLVWLKNRSEAYNHQVYDSVRGAGNSSFSKSLVTNNNQAESWSSSTNGYLSSFDANGFSLTQGGTNADAVNRNNNDYVAWVWKGGGDAVPLTNTGNINSEVSVNNEAGFSIVKASYGSGDYTKTVKHGLTTPPEIIIVKRTDSSGTWYVFEDTTGSLLGSDNHLHLDTNDASDSDTAFSIQSSDTFKTGYSTGAYDIIAYCFHSVSGYSKIGSYTGAGSGTRVYTTSDGTSTGTGGFRPSWIMLKNASVGGTNYDWYIYDTKRDDGDGDDNIESYLRANVNGIEVTSNTGSNGIVMEDDGFTLDIAATSINGSGNTFIYMAFK